MQNRPPQSQNYSLLMLVLGIVCTVFFAFMTVIESAHRYASLGLVLLGLATIMRQYRLWIRARFFKP